MIQAMKSFRIAVINTVNFTGSQNLFIYPSDAFFYADVFNYSQIDLNRDFYFGTKFD